MDASHVLLALLALFVGAAAGAVAMAVLFRRRLADLQDASKHDGDRLAELSTRLAGVEAERRMLAEQNRQLSAQDEQENTVLRALIPVGEKLKLVQQQVSLLERDRVEQFGQLPSSCAPRSAATRR